MQNNSLELPYKGKRILLFEGRARQCLPLIRSFRKQGCFVAALCSSRLDVAYASRYVNKKYLGVCDNQNEKEMTELLLQILKNDSFDLVVPTTDFSATILSKNKTIIEQYAKTAICDFETFLLAEDKNNTMRVCMENGIPCPKTLLSVKTIEDIDDSHIGFPLVVKPKTGYGAIGFKVINDREQLLSVVSKMQGALEEYVFQEYIPQTDLQYECAMFVDDNGLSKTSVVFSKNRWFPIEGGSSTLNITVERPDIIDSCKRLLSSIKWRGAADIDLIQDPRDGVAKIMEINPRVSGSVRIIFDAGVDIGLQMLQTAFGDNVHQFSDYEIGRRLRCSQTDFLWFLKSPNRFRAKPSWFSCHKTRDQIFYWSDPLPYFAFTIKGVKNYKAEMKKRTNDD